MQDPVRTRQNSPVDESGVEGGCVLTAVHVEQNQVEVSLNEVHTQLLPECCSPLARLCVRLIQLLLVLDLEIISKVIYKTHHAPKSQREWFSFRQLFESGTFLSHTDLCEYVHVYKQHIIVRSDVSLILSQVGIRHSQLPRSWEQNFSSDKYSKL